MVFQDRWDRTWIIIAKLTSMDMEDSEGMHWARMESIRGFLLYVTRKYWDMTPYLKGLSLTLDSWRLYIDKEG